MERKKRGARVLSKGVGAVFSYRSVCRKTERKWKKVTPTALSGLKRGKNGGGGGGGRISPSGDGVGED